MLTAERTVEAHRTKATAGPRETIVDIVSGGDVTLSDLLKELRARGIDDQTRVKAALWSLIAESALELTPQRLLRRRR